jgi:hypothetical protein
MQFTFHNTFVILVQFYGRHDDLVDELSISQMTKDLYLFTRCLSFFYHRHDLYRKYLPGTSTGVHLQFVSDVCLAH